MTDGVPPGSTRSRGEGPRSGAPRVRQLGPIRILGKLGHGGMGAVYVGFDLDSSRFVAVKTLFSELAEDPRVRARFEQEAKVYSRLDHPNIVRFLGRSPPEERTQWISLEYVNGVSLRALLNDEGGLPPGDVLDLVEELARALDHAHSRGIIHRDVKPHNVLVNQDGVLKLVDFGIARVSNTSGVGTETGQVLGTYLYAPPEQNQGKEIDQTADLYSVGVMAWEMLTGRHPFPGGNPQEIVLRQLKGPPDPPSSLVDGLPPELDEILASLCRPHPEDRFRSAADLGKALRGLRRSASSGRHAGTFFGDDVHEKWTLARGAYKNGQASLASSLARFVIRQRDDFAPAHFMLAKLYAERDLALNAIESFEKAVTLQPGNRVYLLEFALALYRMGRLSEAHKEVMRMLVADPEDRVAQGFEEILRERITRGRESELEREGAALHAPLWFEDGAKPSEILRESKAETGPPAPPGAREPGEIWKRVASGVPAPASGKSRGRGEGSAGPGAGGPGGQTASSGAVPIPSESPGGPEGLDPERAAGLSRLLPGLGHLWLGYRGRGLALIGVTLWLVALLGLAASWQVDGMFRSAARVGIGLLAGWCLIQVWIRSAREAVRLALRESTRSRIEKDLGAGTYRIGVGSRRGVRSGMLFQVLRATTATEGSTPVLVRLGELRIDRVRPHASEGLFEPSPGALDQPAEGDPVELEEPSEG